MQRLSMGNDIAGTLAIFVYEAWRMDVRNMVSQTFNVLENTTMNKGPSSMHCNLCGHKINRWLCHIAWDRFGEEICRP